MNNGKFYTEEIIQKGLILIDSVLNLFAEHFIYLIITFSQIFI